MKSFLLFAIILFTISIQAQVTQEWVRTFSSPFNGLDYGKFIERDNAGNQSVQFNANNLASGIYLYKFQAGGFVETKKTLLLK